MFVIGLVYSSQAFAQGMDSDAHPALSAYASPETMGSSPYMGQLPGQFPPLPPSPMPPPLMAVIIREGRGDQSLCCRCRYRYP